MRVSPHGCASVRHLIVCFGDQLTTETRAFESFDPSQDAVWMAEASAESTLVWSSKARIALFLSAMRHFRDHLRESNIRVFYTELTPQSPPTDLFPLLAADLQSLQPASVQFTRPGEWRILEHLREVLDASGLPFTCHEDDHFFTTPAQFAAHAQGRKSLRMEFFYRELRKQTGMLMDPDGNPTGGKWNFDTDNRKAFPRTGPEAANRGPGVKPDALTREVLDLVNARFADHPGQLDAFQWPVTREAALALLQDFITHRLPDFGTYQDAMWTGEPWLFHSWISAALNLKLLHPREVCEAALNAYRERRAPLHAVEGFIRQILGWREYVRGVYWHFMPGYLERNQLQADRPLPAFYWTGDTEFQCLRATLKQTLALGYAHHIQRLMVTGLFTLLLGVDPKQVHAWYLAVYVDAVEWVELPNTLGMSQFADGGIMASKPYAATGKYIQRMSNYCQQCPKDPSQRTGPDACPFTTLYWDFLLRHEDRLSRNPRMSLQLRNLERLSTTERAEIQNCARELIEGIEAGA